eukprot:superscaffoldBa00002639_g14873
MGGWRAMSVRQSLILGSGARDGCPSLTPDLASTPKMFLNRGDCNFILLDQEERRLKTHGGHEERHTCGGADQGIVGVFHPGLNCMGSSVQWGEEKPGPGASAGTGAGVVSQETAMSSGEERNGKGGSVYVEISYAYLSRGKVVVIPGIPVHSQALQQALLDSKAENKQLATGNAALKEQIASKVELVGKIDKEKAKMRMTEEKKKETNWEEDVEGKESTCDTNLKAEATEHKPKSKKRSGSDAASCSSQTPEETNEQQQSSSISHKDEVVAFNVALEESLRFFGGKAEINIDYLLYTNFHALMEQAIQLLKEQFNSTKGSHVGFRDGVWGSTIDCFGRSCYVNSSLQSLLTLEDFVCDVSRQEWVWSPVPKAQLMSRLHST